MKLNKVYKLIFNEIIKNGCRGKFDLDDDNVFITLNGYYGFVIPKKETPFNLEMIKNTMGKIDLLSVVKPENLLRTTNNYVMVHLQGLVKVFCNSDRKVYINTKYLKHFEDDAEFYQEKDLSLCVVVENGKVVGAVCPIRHIEEKE